MLRSTAVLKVTRVKFGGAIWDWNKENPGNAVAPGSVIVSVNGKKGSPCELVQMIRANSRLNLIIMRPTETVDDICWVRWHTTGLYDSQNWKIDSIR